LIEKSTMGDIYVIVLVASLFEVSQYKEGFPADNRPPEEAMISLVCADPIE
jgi:hypothetical protein